MGYSYSPNSGGRKFGKRSKQLAVAGVIILFVGTFYFMGNTLTSYATYNKNLEMQLNNTQGQLLQEQEMKEQCEASLSAAKDGLNTCNADKIFTSAKLESCQNNVVQLNRNVNELTNKSSNLSSSLDACKNSYSSTLESYRQLARNSVKAICCSFGDVQSGAARNWNITNNNIVCSGNYTINCTSGESNY